MTRKSDEARAHLLGAGLVTRVSLAEAEELVENGPAPGPRPTGEFRAFLLESGGLSREERLSIETDDRRAVEALKEDSDSSAGTYEWAGAV